MKTNALAASLLCSLVVGLGATVASHAATLTVEKLGGGQYKTIQAAVDAASPGDLILIGPGLYEESVTLSDALTLQGTGPQFTKIRGPASGIYVPTDTKATIRAMSITGLGGSSVTASFRTTLDIRNCALAFSLGYGLWYGDQSHASGTLVMLNCTIYGNHADGIWLGNNSNGGSASIRNTVFANNNGWGLINYCVSTSEDYNDFFGNGSGATTIPGCGGSLTTGAHSISSNPLLLDPNSDNFLLKNGSPCLNAGVPEPAYRDPDGSRNDMGAYGGPGAAKFWPYVKDGPVIEQLDVSPGRVPKGGKITIQATGRVP